MSRNGPLWRACVYLCGLDHHRCAKNFSSSEPLLQRQQQPMVTIIINGIKQIPSEHIYPLTVKLKTFSTQPNDFGAMKMRCRCHPAPIKQHFHIQFSISRWKDEFNLCVRIASERTRFTETIICFCDCCKAGQQAHCRLPSPPSPHKTQNIN